MSERALREFADKLGDIMPLLAREFMRSNYTDPDHLRITMPQFMILYNLNRNGEAKMSDIARHMGVTTAAVTGLVDRLVRDGYVSREHDIKDRRIVKVCLTEKGAKSVGRMLDNRRRVTMKMFGVVSQSDRDTYLRILSQITSRLSEKGKTN